jgi:hypothetical protein
MIENHILNKNELFCKNCYFRECRCKNLGIINRRHAYLSKTFDLKKMERYFGISDTDISTHSISLQRKTRFHYDLTIKKLNVYDPLATYIRFLPRDVNNLIYSYLRETNFVIKIRVSLPRDYPFDLSIWTVTNYVKDGKLQDVREETKKARCLSKNLSPTMMLDKEILCYVSTLLNQ